MREKILTEHKSWKLPSRRVQKFVKLHIKKQKNASKGEDESQKSTSSMSKRFLKRMFRSGKKDKENTIPEVINEKEIAKETAPAPESAPELPAEPVAPEPLPASEEDDKPEDGVKVDPYEDDNRREKKEDCACETCIIL